MISDREEFNIDAGISNIVGALTDPVIVYPGGWGDSLPDWIKTEITLERMIENVKALRKETPTGTDAEAAAYLMTLSLTRPMSDSWSKIYLYVAGQCMRKHMKTANQEFEMPEEISIKTLSESDMWHLNELKAWIYKKRVEVRKERDRAERHKPPLPPDHPLADLVNPADHREWLLGERIKKNIKKEVKQQDIFVSAENKQQNFF